MRSELSELMPFHTRPVSICDFQHIAIKQGRCDIFKNGYCSFVFMWKILIFKTLTLNRWEVLSFAGLFCVYIT